MEKMDKILKDWLISFGVAILLVIIVYNICWPMQVDGESMYPTLNDGKYIFVSKAINYLKPLEVGDIIVIDYVENSEKEKIVKRIIGTEGSHIVIKDGKVMINSKELEEPYVNGITEGDIDLFVPRNTYFVLGDNRAISKDSRYFGCIDEKVIRGKVVYK